MGYNAFGNCKMLTSIEIPKSLNYISTDYTHVGPFSKTPLETVTFEKGTLEIANSLFADCNSLLTVEIPDTVTTIGGSAFYNSALTKLELPYSVTTIEQSAFSNTKLAEINIPDSVNSIEKYAFKNCRELSIVNLNSKLKKIAEGMFEGSGINEIIIPESTVSISMNAFADCANLKMINLPGSLTSIAANSFRNCDSLEELIIPDSVSEIGNYAFAESEKLNKVKISSKLTEISSYLFYECPNLTEISLPYGVIKVDNYAFGNCTKLTSIKIPRTTTSISNTAFSYPERLTIFGVSGTFAETYANENNIKFINKPVSANSIIFDESLITLYKGKSLTLNATITPIDFTDEIVWKSTDNNVVTVDNIGKITAKNVGDATIKVTVGNVSATCKVKVIQPVTSISLNKTSLVLDALETYQLIATVYPNNAFNKEIEWSSSNPEIASVSNEGMVTAHKKGNAIITVKTKDGSEIEKKVNITVNNTAHIISGIKELESPHNYENNCSDYWVYSILNAEKLFVTFDEKTIVEEDFDFIYLYDANGKEIGIYTGTQLAGKTIEIIGNTVKIQLISDASGNAWGFKVAQIIADKKIPELKLHIVNSGLNLTWNEVVGATGYTIYRSTKSDSGFTYLASTISTSYTDTKVTEGITYYYKVRAYTKTDGVQVNGEFSEVVSGSKGIGIPNLTVTGSNEGVLLKWNGVTGATGYTIYRSTKSDSGFTYLASTVSTSYTDTKVTEGTTYYYKVRAYTKTDGVQVNGEFSEVVSGSKGIGIPNLTVTGSNEGVLLKWNGVTGATGYTIYRSTKSDSGFTYLASTVSTSYTDTKVTEGTTYYYKVRAYAKFNGIQTNGEFSSVQGCFFEFDIS